MISYVMDYQYYRCIMYYIPAQEKYIQISILSFRAITQKVDVITNLIYTVLQL